ncbi:oligosaccharide flippase family protein [Uliginosibacterium sp. H3]|uniref:Oligosaccharide flippase family protein n=1 Tax=Uliginosibacterium silvisoli TaxID=3114758 RepID=A0ABU6K6C8_9RHOO|nr:oligosaccharide flippase family protein [Uliginosibacterium sp. H3]
MVNIRRSLIINFLSGSGATVINFLVSLILARLLSPAEIGIFSMTFVFVGVAHVFRDFGVATYIEREKDLTPEKIRAAIGVLFACSWTIAVLLFFASGAISTYFGQAQIRPVMQVLALGFIFIPFGSITLAMLNREYAAGKQARVMVAGTLSYAVSCLSLAYLGFGALALAWANLINIIATALACAAVRPQGMPWMPSLRHWRSVVHFGAGSLITAICDSVNNALPDTLLGKFGDPHRVGLFSRANSTVSIFTYIAGSTVNYGAVRFISQAHHRGDHLGSVMSRMITLLTGIGWPALALTAVFGQEVILALYGESWLAAVPAIPALAAAAAISMTFNYTPIALAAIGKPYLAAIPLFATIVARVACALVFFSGSIQSFSWIICAATLAAAPCMVLLQVTQLNYSTRQTLEAVRGSALITIVCALAGEGLLLLLSPYLPPRPLLLVAAIPLAAIWYGSLRLSRHPLRHEVDSLAASFYARLPRLRT